jgi:hypothetical protein
MTTETTQRTHTPGPWASGEGRDITAKTYGCVARTYGPTLREQQANARLIAAAPALLTQVRLLARHVEEMGCTCATEEDYRSDIGHGKDCMGVKYAADAYALLAQIEGAP